MNGATGQPSVRRRARAPTAIAVLLIAGVAACSSGTAERYSGTVQAPSAAVGSTIGGRVAAVLVQDGSRVRAGDAIVRFDDAQERATYDNAVHEAAVAAAAVADLRAGTRAPDLAHSKALAAVQREQYESAQRSQVAQLAALRERIRQAQAQVVQNAAALRDTRSDEVRTVTLYRTGDVSGAARDAAVARAAQAQAQVANAAAAARAAQADLAAASTTLPRTAAAAQAAYRAAQDSVRSLAAGARPNAIRGAAAQAAAAQASVALARTRLDELTVRAPAAGTINASNLHAGDMVAPGASVATVDEDGEPFVRVYVPQTVVGRVRVGSAVDVFPDSMPGRVLRGTVEQIDARAQFTPGNVETSDDRAHLSFGVKVRVHDGAARVPGGTTAAVAIP